MFCMIIAKGAEEIKVIFERMGDSARPGYYECARVEHYNTKEWERQVANGRCDVRSAVLLMIFVGSRGTTRFATKIIPYDTDSSYCRNRARHHIYNQFVSLPQEFRF